MIKEISRWFWMKKLLLTIAYFEHKDKKARKRYCRRGYHKLTSSSVSYHQHNKRRSTTIRYLKCRHCNFYFFASKAQKELYLSHEKTAKEGFYSFLKSSSCSKPRDFSGDGEQMGKHPSAIVSKKIDNKK